RALACWRAVPCPPALLPLPRADGGTLTSGSLPVRPFNPPPCRATPRASRRPFVQEGPTMRKFILALVLGLRALAPGPGDAGAQYWRHGRWGRAWYNTRYYPVYAYSYPAYGSYGYGYVYPAYGYAAWPTGVSVYYNPWLGAGVAVNAGGVGVSYGAAPVYYYGGYRYPYYYWR